MSYQPYELNVISHHEQFKNKTLKKYTMAGLDYVGAWGNEPFEVVFKNNSFSRVQVKLSIDGTDILTGEPADTQTTSKMWVVNGYSSLKLKAWPETNKGGAAFMFTSADKSVAVNTHGDLSSRGVIAAAVYTEGYTQPITYFQGGGINIGCGGGFYGSSGMGSNYNIQTLGGISFNSCSNQGNSLGYTKSSASIDTRRCSHETKSLQSLASVGAGQHVEQKIETATGLIQPVLGPIVRVRYMWWTELCEELKRNNISSIGTTSGFPGEERRLMSIGSTPRLDNWTPPPPPQPEFSRF